jgi:CheY-like chemotaxis protein
VKTILVVDDNADLRKVISRILEVVGYNPISAANGNEGVEKAISEKPDLILLDAVLPDMDGPAAARLIRADLTSKDIPIIAMTGVFDSLIRQSCLEAGCNDYLVKPFPYELLNQKLRAWMP